jgi:hypothetical protein
MYRRRILSLSAVLACAACAGGSSHRPDFLRFSVTVPASLYASPITGRVYVLITTDSADSAHEPRLRLDDFTASTPLFAVDVDSLAPGQAAAITDTTLGFPVAALHDIPAGDYYVQAVVAVYTQFHRSDGHTVWAHMDQWEGQHVGTSPGSLVSTVQRVHLDPNAGYNIPITVSRVLPPIPLPPDSKWVKHVKIQSAVLTKFWGQPTYLGATVLLPAGYETHPEARYPVIYEQGHFNLRPPLDFDTVQAAIPEPFSSLLASYNLQTGYDLYRAWSGPGFPRMIAVSFQHPTPYFDDSYAVNSANNGPYGDAIMHELIPYIESHFRTIAKPYARVLTGGSTGGWESLALQLYHPDFFGGTWTLYPDPIDFDHYGLVNAYRDTNAFAVSHQSGSLFSPVNRWFHAERYMMRDNDGQPFLTMRDLSRFEDVLGSHGRSGEQLEIWEAVYGPVGADGYPVPLWDKRTGHINHDVATYMRDSGYDLTAYARAHWPQLGPQLTDKIHIDVGDMDNFYLDLGVYDFQAFLDSTQQPHVTGVFRFGRPEKGHGWQHTNNANLVREMADAIAKHAAGGDTSGWRY